MIDHASHAALDQIRQMVDDRSSLHNKLFLAMQQLHTAELMAEEMQASILVDGMKLAEAIAVCGQANALFSQVMNDNYQELKLARDQECSLDTVPVNLPLVDGDGSIIGWYEPETE